MQIPRFEYSRSKLSERINKLTKLESPNGLVVRYALKANPHPEIISMMNDEGVHFDASSSYEADDLLKLGIQNVLDYGAGIGILNIKCII